MPFESGSRRAALDGLTRILDAGGLEELFAVDDDSARFVHHLLHEVARGRSSPYYWEVCRTARRRGVTPEFVIDRATVLLTSIEERRRTDIYRILGVAPLASADAIRARWHEVAKQLHPDVGGDATRFRQVKEAYEILRDDGRRLEYERFWLRAVGPIARVTDGDDDVPAAPVASGITVRPTPERRVVMVAKRTPAPPVEPALGDTARSLAQASARFGEVEAALDSRLAAAGVGSLGGVRELVLRVEHLLAPIPIDDLARARADVDRGIDRLERLRDDLTTLADLKRRLSA